VVVLLACSVSVLWVFVESGCVLFRFVLAFELTGCCAVFVLGCFVACPFVSASSLCCRRWGWFFMLALFLFWSASCWPGCSRLDYPRVLWVFIFTPLLMQVCVHAVWRVGSWYLFVRSRLLLRFLWFLFRWVVCCGVLDVWRVQLVGWLGGPRCRVLNWFLFVCSAICAGVGFVESGAFVAFALGFGLGYWPCGDSVGCKEVWCFACSFAVGSCVAHLSTWDCGVVFVVAVLQICTRSLMGGYSRWRVLVLAPVWSTWNSAVRQLILSEFTLWCFSVAVFTSPPPRQTLIVVLIFGFLFS